MKSAYDDQSARCRAYAAQFNIDLFNAAAQLAISTTEAPKQVKDVQSRLSRLLWYERTDAAAYFEHYGIRYFGELLERYGEKLGDDIANTRAIALAMGWCVPLLTPNMFVAAQRRAFMKKLSEINDDLYIMVARYLLAEDVEKRTLHDKLLAWGHRGTEEVIFTLCSLEDTAATYDALRPKLVSVLSEKRTLPVLDNAGIYAWMIATCRNAISSCRKKDNALLRALMALSTGYVRETNAAHGKLVEAGLSSQDILYLNSMLIWESGFRHCQVDPDSLPAEHLASDFVVTILNAHDAQPDSVLNYVKWLLSRYFRFDIKLEKTEGIWEYISGDLDVTCPETMLWMLTELKKDYAYRFDVLDARWDILAQRLPCERYHDLFRKQMTDGNKPTETVRAMLDKYAALTGRNYTEAFEAYSGYESVAFSLLVRHGIIDLWAFFDAHKQAKREPYGGYGVLDYVWDVVEGVKTPEAFAFWKMFFEEYTPQDLSSFFRSAVFHDAFFRRSSYSYSYGEYLSFHRDFLTREENKQLYEWIDASAFAYKAEDYPKRVLSFLKSDDAYVVFDLAELKPVYDALRASHPELQGLEMLKSRFLTEEELAADKAEKEARELARKQAAAEAERKKICDGMDEAFDGTLTSIRKYMERKAYWDRDMQYAAHHARDLLGKVLDQTHEMSRREYRSMLHILGNMVAYDDLPIEMVLTAVQGVFIMEENEKGDGV